MDQVDRNSGLYNSELDAQAELWHKPEYFGSLVGQKVPETSMETK